MEAQGDGLPPPPHPGTPSASDASGGSGGEADARRSAEARRRKILARGKDRLRFITGDVETLPPLGPGAGAEARPPAEAAVRLPGPTGSQAGASFTGGPDRGHTAGDADAQPALERQQQQPGAGARDPGAAAATEPQVAAAPEHQPTAANSAATVRRVPGVQFAGGAAMSAFLTPNSLLANPPHMSQASQDARASAQLQAQLLASLSRPSSQAATAPAAATAALGQGGAGAPGAYLGRTARAPPSQALAVASMQRVHAAAVASAPARGVLSALLGALCALAWASGAPLQCPGESPLLRAWHTGVVPILPPGIKGLSLSLPRLPAGPLLVLLLSDALLLLSCAMLGLGASGTAKGTSKESGGNPDQGSAGGVQGSSGQGFSSPLDLLGALGGGSTSDVLGGSGEGEGAGGVPAPEDFLLDTIRRAQYALSRGSMALFTLSSVARDMCFFFAFLAAGVILLCPEVALVR